MSTPAISLQLYTVNAALEPDHDGGLARLAEIGFRTVEAFDFVRRADDLAAAFARHGLKAATGHAFLVESEMHLPDGTTLPVPPVEQTFDAAATLGMTTVFEPYVAPENWTTRGGVERVADRLNELSAAAAGRGITVGYHNHDHELRPRIDGRPSLEVLAELLDPAVALEVDLYWAAAAGVDPVALVGRLGDRVRAVHVKDGPIGDHIVTGVPPVDQTPAGQGDVPLADALKAADSIDWAVIEFDGFGGDIFEGVAGSHAFLAAELER